MARKKASTSKALVNVDQELQKELESFKERLGSSEKSAISIRDKVFTFPDGSIVDGAPLEVVIIDFINWNQYYESDWDPKNPSPPACFAYDRVLSKMAPSDNAPNKQNPTCAGCEMNEFGSGKNDSKACKNQRRIVVMRPDDDPTEGPLFTITVPPASIKKYDGYVNSVARVFQAPPLKVITSIYFHPETTYPSLLFGNPKENPNYALHYQRRGEAEELLTAEPDVTMYEPPAPKRNVRRKAAAKR